MRLALLVIGILFVYSSSCFGQVDSTYVAQYEKQTALKFSFGKNFIIGIETDKNKNERQFLPNNPLSLGLGMSIYNTVISFNYSYGFDFTRDKKKGKTKSTDFQFHKYGRKFVFDVYYQKYTGFYQQDENDKVTALHPDMKMRMYGASGQYIFNNKKFSYPAAFNQSEKQLKSAGSFLVGLGIYSSKISHANLGEEGAIHLRNVQFGVNGGYAHTFVIKRWYISMAGSAGVHMGGDTFSKSWTKTKVYPTILMRIGAAYNQDNWSIAMSYVNNMTMPTLNKDRSMILLSGNAQITYTLRLQPIPFLSNAIHKIDQLTGWAK